MNSIRSLYQSIIAILFFASASWTCNVPVYRYALERWPTDPYDISLCYEGHLSPEEQAITDLLLKASVEGTGHCNYRVNLIDLQEEPFTPLHMWLKERETSLPCLLVRYPSHTENPEIIDTGPLTEDTIHALVESPARSLIATRLLDGDTGIWIYLESGDRERDDALFTRCETFLRNFEKNALLPDLSDVSANDTVALDESAPPLCIQFSMLRISRTDPQEQTLVNMLLHSEEDLLDYDNAPILFPIFGRARILYALVDQGITNENLQEAAQFLIGPCSCLIKDLNPGVDLLMPVNWEDSLENFLVKDRMIPPPFGLAEIALTEIASATADIAPFREDPAVEPSQDFSSSLLWNILLSLGFIILINGIFWIYYRKKTSFFISR